MSSVSKTPAPAPDILTVAEAAKFLKISVTQLYGLTSYRGRVRHEHPIPTIRLGTKSLRFRRSSLEVWLGQLEAASVAA